MFRSFLLGLLALPVLLMAMFVGLAMMGDIGTTPALLVMLAGLFVAGYLSYLSKHTTRIRK